MAPPREGRFPTYRRWLRLAGWAPSRPRIRTVDAPKESPRCRRPNAANISAIRAGAAPGRAAKWPARFWHGSAQRRTLPAPFWPKIAPNERPAAALPSHKSSKQSGRRPTRAKSKRAIFENARGGGRHPTPAYATRYTISESSWCQLSKNVRTSRRVAAWRPPPT
jgi:hypothetical protein